MAVVIVLTSRPFIQGPPRSDRWAGLPKSQRHPLPLAFNHDRMNCKRLIAAACAVCFATVLLAQDTTWVQTYTWEEQNNPETAYDNPGRRWFTFPEGTESTQKILMYYKLRCFEDGTAGNLGFPCGEWDYLSYSYLFEHTGILDSLYSNHPHFKLDNQDFETADVLYSPYFHTAATEYFTTSVASSTTSFTTELSLDETDVNYPFGSFLPSVRTQVLWTADDLSGAGLGTGEVHGFRLNVAAVGSTLEDLHLRVALTDETEASAFVDADWTEAHFAPTDPEMGWFEIWFAEPIDWDGTSSIVADFSFDNGGSFGTDSPVRGGDVGFNSVVTAAGGDRYLKLGTWDGVQVPQQAFETVDEQVTVSMWLRGGESLPVNTTTFEGVNADGNRVLNAHIPWGNSNVYWDAGWDGGYDRINALATPEALAGTWNHWAFTKNTATGTMNIYLNGTLWLTGNDRDNSMAGIETFFLGGNAGQSLFWDGDLDEFAVWDVELDQATIQNWMYRDLTAAHPNSSNLRVYYKFNAPSGALVEDVSGNGFGGIMVGSPQRVTVPVDELFRNLAVETVRPDVQWVMGNMTFETTVVPATEMIAAESSILATYAIDGNTIDLTGVDEVWPAGYAYTYDLDGAAIDSTWTGGEATITNDTLFYYQAPFEVINRYEIGRYITPYGIGLDLDDDGWTWVFDVTDYMPLLQGQVELECGNWQELLDLRFAFISGTPPRDILGVENVWSGSFGATNWEENIPERTIALGPDVEGVRLKTRTSGHGNPGCAEFCFNTHSVEVNGTTQFEWEIMQECADNGLYPQGGTWIYDRAGWCPGADVPTRDFELTPFISGNSVTLDYDANNLSQGNYVFEGQLITYGAHNYTVDPEIAEILSPTKFKLHNRKNNTCTGASFVLRNNGEEPLTSVTITYGVEEDVQENFVWEGELAFNESTVVELVYDHPSRYAGGEDSFAQFQFELSMPNGIPDPNPTNNYAESTFYRPEVFSYGEGADDDNRLIVWVATNSAYFETEYELFDRLGNSVFLKNDFDQGNFSFRDTLQLNAGCYTLQIRDSDDDGMDFFANNDGGGYVRMKQVQGPTLHSFEADFGKEVSKTFFWDTDLVSVLDLPNQQPTCVIHPNPTAQGISVRYSGLNGQLELVLHDASGRVLREEMLPNSSGSGTIDLRDWRATSGLYFLRLKAGGQVVTRRVVVE